MIQYKQLSLFERDMQQQSILGQFYRYLSMIESKEKNYDQQITVERLMSALQHNLQAQMGQSTIFKQQYFAQIMKAVCSTIMNSIFKQKLQYINIKHIVAYFSIFQYLLHSQKLKFPNQISLKLSKYIHNLLILQQLQAIRQIYQFSLNSNIINHFYHNIYIHAYQHRYHKLIRSYGIIQQHPIELPLVILKLLIQSKQYNLEPFTSKVTPQWILLSLVYFYLYCKYQETYQMPIFSAILQAYNKGMECKRHINGDELSQFYNNFVLEQIGKVQSGIIHKLIQQTNFDNAIVQQFIVSPLYNDNNTVLDNLIFTSSLEPSLQP